MTPMHSIQIQCSVKKSFIGCMNLPISLIHLNDEGLSQSWEKCGVWGGSFTTHSSPLNVFSYSKQTQPQSQQWDSLKRVSCVGIGACCRFLCHLEILESFIIEEWTILLQDWSGEFIDSTCRIDNNHSALIKRDILKKDWKARRRIVSDEAEGECETALPRSTKKALSCKASRKRCQRGFATTTPFILDHYSPNWH